MTEDKTFSLSTAIASKYIAVDTPTVVEQPVKKDKTGRKTGSVICDLRTGTISQADDLVANGYRGIKLKKNEHKGKTSR